MKKVRLRNSPWLRDLDAFGCRLLLWHWTQSKFSLVHFMRIGLWITEIIFCFFSSFTYPQIILIWGNFIAFYMINLIVSAVPTLQMYTIMFRLCSQPSYWITMGVSLLFFYDTIVVNHDLLLQPNLTLPQTIWWNHLLAADCCGRNGPGAGFEILQEHVST